jgi:glycine cleavage system transcriptional repressor
MPQSFVLTLTGRDRVGIVEELTRAVLERGGNVEASRMARLGGEFAVLMLVTAPASLDLEGLASRGYKVLVAPASLAPDPSRVGWTPYRIRVDGADHEGIIHEVAQQLAEHGISIEEMESDSSPAPTSGAPLFSMNALVLVPPEVPGLWWQKLKEIGSRMNLEVDINAIDDE